MIAEREKKHEKSPLVFLGVCVWCVWIVIHLLIRNLEKVNQ